MATINLKRGIDEGTHKLRIMSLEEKYGPSGYPYLIFQLKIVQGDSKDQTFSDMLSLSPQSRFRMEPFLDAIKAPPKGSIDSSEFVGKYAWGVVEMDTSRTDKNGDVIKQPRVKTWLLPPEDDTEEEEDEEEIAQVSIPELEEEEDESPFSAIEETVASSNGGKKSKRDSAEKFTISKEEVGQLPF